uniref:DNA_MISMATCH_REPAIR_2 domain-containing protein n=1 Tax=Caenorhabditis tropicalis TaxID=1561998 RepID=A0A1I7TKI1_9PELO
MSDPEYDPKTLWVPPDFHQKQTPGHRQWWNIKSKHYDTIILFKVGKFYETYHMDAVEVVRALNIAFMRGSYAHAGFPEHAASKFADQLMNHGYKVARVEQTETPQMLEERNQKTQAKDKVVRREVCRVTSNGTRTYGVLDGVDLGNAASTLDPTSKNLLAIKEFHNVETGKSSYGICLIDTTTAHIRIGQFEDDDYRSQLRTLLANVIVVQTLVERSCISSSTKSIINGILFSVPIELLLPKKQFMTADDVVRVISNDDYYGSDVSGWPDVLKSMLDESSVLPKAASEWQLALSALGAVVWYLRDSLIDVDMLSMRNITLYESNSKKIETKNSNDQKQDWSGKNLILDGTALENLNIVPNGRDSHSTSLYYVINKCSTPFGRRLLRSWLLQPTCDPKTIRLRQEAIKWMTSADSTSFTTIATSTLKKIPDLDRLLQKIHTIGLKYRSEKHPDSRAIFFDTLKTNQKKIGELLAAIDGFKLCNTIRKEYIKVQNEGEGCELLDELLGNEQQMEEIDENIYYFERMFDRTTALKDGKIVPNKGCDEEYDEALSKVKEAMNELNAYKDTIAKKYSCSIKFVDSGKVKYLLEMPESTKVSSMFELKSRRKGFIRYSTPDSEELVASLDAAEKEKAKLGDDATRRVFEQFGHKNPIWLETVKLISSFDVLTSLATFSKSSPFDMCMPEFDFESAEPYLIVEKGVHPCLAIQSRNEVTQTSSFIANSTTMGNTEAAVMLLTGPNMGGKSTLMRQTAVLAILAHLGCMVPADAMRLTPIDRIFTRIGANDRIMCGESTFFIELKETDIMLKNATKHSLLLIDELGRGTSTFDGTAIASAVLQSIADTIFCRTFFSTHYHSICDSFTNHPHVRLAHMKCVVDKENNEDPTMEDVTFLYELESGICPKSYGFYAAKLAGIDQQVVRNAYAESNKFASNLIIDPKVRHLIECARNDSFDVDELKAMVEAL